MLLSYGLPFLLASISNIAKKDSLLSLIAKKD